jgi:SAM-dependent methyltransferase
VIAIDLGASVDVARANTDPEWVACIQADVRALPLRDASADWAYSLGVLHHTDDPAAGLAEIARCVRPGGRVLLYLYYALEQRGLLYRALFRLVDRLRRITSHLPRRIVVAFAALMAILAYWPLARLARLLAAIGREDLARSMPLGFYRTLPLRIMFNDSLDRFGTTLERRFTRSAMQRLMERSGLSDVAFSERPPHWRAVGRRD